MKKRIAVFSTAWNGEHIGGILRGMCKKTKETQDDLYIFNTYGGFESEKEYNECEYNIFHLPLDSDMDGVIILSNNIDSISRLSAIIRTCREKEIPCISVELDIPEVHFVGIDNYAAMTTLVEHLLTEHQCRTLNYVGGPADHIENCQRKQAFLDVMKKHGLSTEEMRMRDYDFTIYGGERAFEDFYSQGLAFPDAVVCANDNMAIGYMEAMERQGFHVPEDTIVTGFDNLFEAKYHVPGITSVGRSKEKLGEDCVEQILGMINGKEYPDHVFLPFEFQPNESCGCEVCSDDLKQIIKRLGNRVSDNHLIRWRMNLIQKRLLACRTVEALNKALYEELQNLGVQKFAILINEDEYIQHFTPEGGKEKYDQSFSSRMRVLFDGKPDDGVDSPRTFETKKLIPEDFCENAEESNIFIFMPLHLNGTKYGYCIMGENIDYIENENLFYWISIMNLVVDNVRQNISIRLLNKKLSHMYMQDAMTGIYNRFALKKLGEPLIERNRTEGRRTLFLFADMDGLKEINDTYGHETGDLSIKEMAKVMQQSCPDRSYICIRYGGDEFLVMGTCENEEMASSIQCEIEKRIRASVPACDVPVKLSASIGYILTSQSDTERSLEEYISQADRMMYQIKKKRKNEIK
ncbi:MAG: GGDEF domain-containing protein [Eubacterium sp.]|nr:GGDEF domain-containing protein [Eubacterium sp.]